MNYLASINWRGVLNVGFMRLFDDAEKALDYADSLKVHGGDPRVYEFDVLNLLNL